MIITLSFTSEPFSWLGVVTAPLPTEVDGGLIPIVGGVTLEISGLYFYLHLLYLYYFVETQHLVWHLVYIPHTLH